MKESNGVDLVSIDKAIESVVEYLTGGDSIFLVWSTEDVISRAEDNGMKRKVTEEEARDILAEMDHRHDCNYGITWETIDSYLDELK